MPESGQTRLRRFETRTIRLASLSCGGSSKTWMVEWWRMHWSAYTGGMTPRASISCSRWPTTPMLAEVRAAWAMGMTGDAAVPRFINATDECRRFQVRWHTIRAMAIIRRSIQRSKLAGELSVTIAPRTKTPDGRASLATIVTMADGSSVPDLHGTDFFLSEKGIPVLDFEVSQSPPTPRLNVGSRYRRA